MPCKLVDLRSDWATPENQPHVMVMSLTNNNCEF